MYSSVQKGLCRIFVSPGNSFMSLSAFLVWIPPTGRNKETKTGQESISDEQKE